MAVIQYLDKRGLKTLVGEIKKRTSNIYTIRGAAVYVDDAFIEYLDGDSVDAKYNGLKDAIDAIVGGDGKGLWQNMGGGWKLITEAKPGWVYNIDNRFTTDDDFIEGAGHDIEAGTNIVAVETDPKNPDTSELKWDVLSMALNLDGYQTKKLVNVLKVFQQGTEDDVTIREYESYDELPETNTGSDDIALFDVALITGDEGKGDVYRATVIDDSGNITWKRLGDQVTVEGSLELLGSVAPNTPIKDSEILKAFEED